MDKKLYQALLCHCKNIKKDSFNNEEEAVFFNLTLINLNIDNMLAATKLLDKKLNNEYKLYSDVLSEVYSEGSGFTHSVRESGDENKLLPILEVRRAYLRYVTEDGRRFLSILIKKNKSNQYSVLVEAIKSNLKVVVNVERCLRDIIGSDMRCKTYSFNGEYETNISEEIIERAKINTAKMFDKK